ncbi:MAG: galactarate dehydratase, partial [Paenibacillus sp.]|nr:galactarate dehydratase [Paenibacillus sp.]
MSVAQPEKEAPLYIKLNDKDNVAIIVNTGGLPKGTQFACGLELVEQVPQGHKVALTDLREDDVVVRYGEVIGYAAKPISRGSWIHEASMRMPTPPKLDELPLASHIPQPLSPLEGYTFEGYRNADGSVGTKNILGITTSVQCVAGVLEYAVKRIKQELLPRYPNVEDVVALTHNYGCGVAINAPDAIIPIRTLQNIALNPNFGGELMVVGLGCEKLQPDRLVPGGGTSPIVSLQDQPGFIPMIKAIMEMAEEKLARLNARQRTTCPASELVIGMQCGGSDAFSGVTANPALGFAADLLVRAGATVMFSEVTEV